MPYSHTFVDNTMKFIKDSLRIKSCVTNQLIHLIFYIIIGFSWVCKLVASWNGRDPPIFADWLDFQIIVLCLDLEDKVHFNGGGNVMIGDTNQAQQEAHVVKEGNEAQILMCSSRARQNMWKGETCNIKGVKAGK